MRREKADWRENKRMPRLPRLENVGVEEMTLDPPNELFEYELDKMVRDWEKEIFDEQFHCDYHGKCKRKPFAEVYVVGSSWSYLCFWHFIQEVVLRHINTWYIIKKGEE